MTYTMQQVIQAELKIREDFANQILTIVKERCHSGPGRVQRGALQMYIYNKLGFIGTPGKDFCKFITKILVEAGYRDSDLEGKRCYCGLSWKGEEKKDWRNPKALDIPHWINNSVKFGWLVEQI